MAKHLTKEQIFSICQIIQTWHGPLTWNALIAHIERSLHTTYSRQALSGHVKIQQAFSTKKKLVSINSPTRSATSDISHLLHQKLQSLKSENESLRSQINSLLEIHSVWIYNAALKGLSEDDMNHPLPPIDRDRSKIDILKEPRRR